MEQQKTQEKLPIPRLGRSTSSGTKAKKSPGTKLLEKRLRDRNRIYLGDAFQRWRDLRILKGFKTDAALATFFLDSYEADSGASTSTPFKRKAKRKLRLPIPALSSIQGESLSERDDDFPDQDPVAQGETPCQETEQRLTSGEITEEINEMDVNNFENSIIDWVEDMTWSPSQETQLVSTFEEDKTVEVDTDSECSDEDYTPTIRIRPGALMSTAINVEGLPAIAVEDTVHDQEEIAEVSETDDPSVPEGIRVEHPDDIIEEQAAIVYHICMKQLLSFLLLPINKCTGSKEECAATAPFEVTLSKRGTAMVVKWICPNGHIVFQWNSQPTFKFKMQAGDFMLSTNILLSGNNYTKVALLFKYMGMGMVTKNTYYAIQDAYCVDIIRDFWMESRESVISSLKQGGVVALGDGRMDSPGFSAQYCTYTMMDNDSKKIISVVNKNKLETQGNSTIMEKVAFIESMDKLQKEVSLTEVCTDAHTQISALFRTGIYKDIGVDHSYDIWHGAKNLGKKIHAVGQKQECKILLQWKKDICNHFWFCCKHAENYDRFFTMWIGLLHHVTNEHEWPLDACQHGPLEPDPNKEWIKKGSTAHKTLADIILNERWLRDVPKYLKFRSTAQLESFHNHLLMYAGKRFYFAKKVYEARVFLAALDYNHHSDRPVKTYPDGSVQGRKLFNKKSRCWGFYALKENKDYSYIPSLQGKIVAARIHSKSGLPKRIRDRPDDPRLLGPTCGVPAPSTKELRDKHVSRGDGQREQK